MTAVLLAKNPGNHFANPSLFSQHSKETGHPFLPTYVISNTYLEERGTASNFRQSARHEQRRLEAANQCRPNDEKKGLSPAIYF